VTNPLLDIVPFLEVVEPASTEIWSGNALVLRYTRPDLLGFLEEEVTGDICALTIKGLMPAEEDLFEKRPLSRALPV